MRIYKVGILLILLLLASGAAYSQESRTEINADFRSNSELLNADTIGNRIRINKRLDNIQVHFEFDKSNIELDYMGNDNTLRNFAHTIDSIGISKIDSIVIISQSSPEGVYEHNLKLSRNRANTMRKYILEKHPELQHCLHVHPAGESWERLREYVEKDTLMRNTTIEAVISIIDSDINVGTKKWRMEQLPVYRYLLKTYYPRLRNSSFYILYYTEIKSIDPIVAEPEPIEIVAPPMKVEVLKKPEVDSIIIPGPKEQIVTTEDWSRKLYLKTNALFWGMGITNVSAEIDLAKHWSFTIPLCYSAWNYFTSTIKFRTLAVQPEFRYWLKEDNQRFFIGAHFGYAQYNVAVDGNYRIQDHNGTSPALGGGISVGYRMPISKSEKWHIEFTLGAGVYGLHYDKFYNVNNGKLVDTHRKTYWGIDNAAINISYRFDLKKRKK